LEENCYELQEKIIKSLEQQGFIINDGKISLPEGIDKDGIRKIHQGSVNAKRKLSRKYLEKKESSLLHCFADGVEINPESIKPRLQEVTSGSWDELLFRYACLHWSIPVSSGYGRRLRFLVYDDSTGKLMGLFGLGDPVFSLSARDQWVGWEKEDKRRRLVDVMDAFVLGAVPPYNRLLVGKLIAMLVASNEVRDAYRRKYSDRRSLISGEIQDGRLALVTTTSALGRSSVYNRIKYNDRILFYSVGYTVGSGDFHFINDIYNEIVTFARKNCKPTAKRKEWGKGFRNRREVIRKVLSFLGLSSRLAYHQVRREVFAVPLASNAKEFLRGEDNHLNYFDQPVNLLFEWFRERWMLPRAKRDGRYRSFNPDTLRLWGEGESDG
jgi:hypothetical protein